MGRKKKFRVCVIGSNGQLGRSIKAIKDTVKDKVIFTFLTKRQLDITNEDAINNYFENNDCDYLINCAAYTNVDMAETGSDNVKINAFAVNMLACACYLNDITFIHISSDYVFDGDKSKPYVENHPMNPINKYGNAKALGEMLTKNAFEKHYIIRTSWLFSEYGSNFLKTILKLSETRETINVQGGDIGKPTYAGDLAKFILFIVLNGNEKYGTYHFTNDKEMRWYDFAKIIVGYSNNHSNIVRDDDYGVNIAERPSYSSLSTKKIETIFKYKAPLLMDAIKKVILKLNMNIYN